jgi:hypothetical protein
MSWIKRHIHQILLGSCAFIFFGLYQFLYWDTYVSPVTSVSYAGEREPGYLIFNQPDEMANYLFIREWVLHDHLGVKERLSNIAGDQLHPRSTTVVQSTLVPIGFPGFIVLVGILLKAVHFLDAGKLFNYLIVMVTPLCAAIAPFFFYAIIKKIFNNSSLALLSAVLLYIHPMWWYSASRPLQQGILFVSAIIFATFCLVRQKNQAHLWTLFLFIFWWGIGLYIRPTEWVWTLIFFVCLGQYLKPKLHYNAIISVAIAATIVGALFFATQTAWYGHPLASGYVRPTTEGLGGKVFEGPQGISFIQALFLPFGIHPISIIKTAYAYLFKLVAPWSLATLFAIALVWYDKKNQSVYKKYIYIFFAVSCYILIYYGSWQFTDNLLGIASIGSSQARYFLPVYVLSLPLIAFLLKKIWENSQTGAYVAGIIAIVLTLFSIKAVFFQFEGLWSVKTTVANYYDIRQSLIEKTPGPAIFVTHYADKYIFPLRRVVIDDKGKEEMSALTQLIKLGFPLFWFNVQLTDDARMQLDQLWASNGLILGDVIFKSDNLELRPIILKP